MALLVRAGAGQTEQLLAPTNLGQCTVEPGSFPAAVNHGLGTTSSTKIFGENAATTLYDCGPGQALLSGDVITAVLQVNGPFTVAPALSLETNYRPGQAIAAVPSKTQDTVTIAAVATSPATAASNNSGTAASSPASSVSTLNPSSGSGAAVVTTTGANPAVATGGVPAATSPSIGAAATALGVLATYGSGWNLVSGPAGATIGGSSGPLYTYQANDTNYEVIAGGGALGAGQGYWAYFDSPGAQTIPILSSQSLSVSLPAGQWVMIGNPASSTATIAGADTVYLYSQPLGYQATTTLGPGQGAWAQSLAGGTATIASR